MTYRFRWMGKGNCHAAFLCNNLDGNMCHDYGLGVMFEGTLTSGRSPTFRQSKKSNPLENLMDIRYCILEHNVTSSFVPVCHEDYAYFAKVPQGGSVTVKMWYNDPDHFKHSTCNVWCFNQHEKPDPRYKESPLQKFFVEVVCISHFKKLCILTNHFTI